MAPFRVSPSFVFNVRTNANKKGGVKTDPIPNLPYDSGTSNGELCNNLEGWETVEVGREIQEGGDLGTLVVNSC